MNSSALEPAKSSSNGRNKLFLSLDNFSNTRNAANGLESDDKRWSDVVPPKSALTFAAMWDPDEGMVTFSGARLLDSRGESYLAVEDPNADPFHEDYPQVLPVNGDPDEFGESSATMATFQDAFKAFLHRIPRNSNYHTNHKHSNTIASSTLGGLDIYSREPATPLPMRRRSPQRYPYFNRLDREPPLTPRSKFGVPKNESPCTVDDEGFYEDRIVACEPVNLKSHFSTTTTSTSNYVAVARSAEEHTFEHPWLYNVDTPHGNFNMPTSPVPSTPRRRLKKRRPDGPSSPISPLSSSSTLVCDSPPGLTPPTSPSGKHKSSMTGTKVVRRMKKGSFDDDWVCIEITSTITTRLVSETS
ncbi:hypothetical protein BJ138DRAFT_1147546 [Hygrophoropsis aurantiaca]|uniref:Uncharacterized protein n=1 Tax=Hygrophoropsis aurantiaca TaxID=72124 RepID=A0ACB8AHY2_9AGAM|nr:hypothetical protein BJ138DRAFT_1147546 [Hygrophoropsis aurantiaca]